MAPKATVVKAELQVSDMDRHYYATHNLTLAQQVVVVNYGGGLNRECDPPCTRGAAPEQRLALAA